MKVIGILGGIGAGKSTVVEIIKSLGRAVVLDTDKMVHDMLLPNKEAYQEIVDYFGQDILDKEGYIIRRKLGNFVFNHPKELERLNQITHPKVYQKVERAIQSYRKEGIWDWVLIDAPLLLEAGLEKLTDRLVGIYADEDIRIKRVIQRDNFTYEQVGTRIRVQKTWKELEEVVDDIINNSSSYECTKEQIKKIIARW